MPRDYIVRNIEPKLWRQVKAKAELANMPVRHVIIALLRAYAEGTVTVDGRPIVGAS